MFKVQSVLLFPTLMPVLTFLADASWLDKLLSLVFGVRIFHAQIVHTEVLVPW